MKVWSRGLLAAAMVCGVWVPLSDAATTNVPQGMAAKATRGVIDLFTGIVELPMQTIKGYKHGVKPIKNTAGSKTVGTILGIFRGIGHAAGRTGWGAMELVGFWSANPEDNEGVGIPLDAQYAWEEGVQYDLFSPSLGEGVKPIGRKLGHGLGNTLLGIAELPGQVIKGSHQGRLGSGIVRGFWFWLSREIYGIGSLYTGLAPNHPDNPGYAFDGEWPWTTLSAETSGGSK